MASKKRVDVSTDDKLKVLESLDTREATIMKVADQSNTSKSQVRRIKQSKESLRQLQHLPSILGKKRKRDREQRTLEVFFSYPREIGKTRIIGKRSLLSIFSH